MINELNKNLTDSTEFNIMEKILKQLEGSSEVNQLLSGRIDEAREQTGLKHTFSNNHNPQSEEYTDNSQYIFEIERISR